MINSATIDTIVFDLGGVLIDLTRENAVKAYEQLGVTNANELLDPYRQKGLFRDLEEGKLSNSEFSEQLRKQYGCNGSDDEIRNAMIQFLGDLPIYKLELISKLRKRYKVYMLSNVNDLCFPWIAETLFKGQGYPTEELFDALFLSYQMNCSKPEKEIFEKMIRESGMAPANTLLIDDSKANCTTAQEMGFHTYCPMPKEDFTDQFADLLK